MGKFRRRGCVIRRIIYITQVSNKLIITDYDEFIGIGLVLSNRVQIQAVEWENSRNSGNDLWSSSAFESDDVG